MPFPGRPLPPEVADNRVLWDLNSRVANDLFGEALNTRRAAIGLPPVDNVYDYAFTRHPWLAADSNLGPLDEPTDANIMQTGAWILPDERLLPAELLAFLDAGTLPVHVGFGSMPTPKDIAQVTIARRVVLLTDRRHNLGPAPTWRAASCCRQPPRSGECLPQQILDLSVGASQLIAGPTGQRVVYGRVQPKHEALAFSHWPSRRSTALIE